MQGILGLSWCQQDSGMLLSTGKDSKTILWDVGGPALGEFSAPSFNFDVQWSPTCAGIFATSSYGGGDGQDGKVSSLQPLSRFRQTLNAQSYRYHFECIQHGNLAMKCLTHEGVTFLWACMCR